MDMLNQASQQDPYSVQGVLSQLLQSYDPEERNTAMQRRDQTREAYQSQLNQPLPDAGPIHRMVSDYLTRYAAKPDQFAAIAGAAGSEGDRTQKMQLAQRQAGLQSAEFGAKRAEDDVKESDVFAKNMFGLAKAGSLGKQPSPEALRTVYTSARNEAAQIAKGYNFSTAEEQSQWIEQQANLAVQNYMKNFATQPSGPRGVESVAQVTAPSSTPPATQEGQAAQAAPQINPGQPTPNAPVESPILRNKPEEARTKEYAVGTEKSALKDYEENVRPAAQIASSMLDTIGMVRQIPRTQDMFAPYREKLGSALNALGMDGAMVKEAQSLQQVRPLLAKIANDRLLMAKGVQTEGDAQRAYNEFVQITDTQQAADFMYAWAEELANRAKFKDQVYKLSGKEKGTMREGSNYWNQTDYAQAAPVAILNGKPWTFTAWRNAFVKANPDAGVSDLLSTWNGLAGRK